MALFTRIRSVFVMIALSSPLLLAGCVSVPDSIKGASQNIEQNFARVHASPQSFVGWEARFGGTVVNVVNQKEGTMLEIAVSPLDEGARPVLGSSSEGRLIAKTPLFLDPVDFKNRLVTVVGKITGSIDGKIGQTPYTYVTMDINGYQRWRLAQQVILPPQPGPWGYGPGPGWHGHGWGPYWGPGWGWYNPGPAQIHTYVTQ